MWARGRAKRRERQRLRAELDVQTAAEISEPVLILLQHRSAHCCRFCTAEGNREIRRDEYLHVRVEFGDSALRDLPLVAEEDFS